MAKGAFLAIVGLIPFLLLPRPAHGLPEALGEYNHGPTSIVVCESAIFVAGHLSGHISVLRPDGGEVTGQFALGQLIGSLEMVPGTNLLVATAESSNELFLLRWQQKRLGIVAKVPVPSTPVHAEPSPDGRWISVSSLWGRSISVFRLKDGQFELSKLVTLPFSPRLQWWSPDGTHLVVVDSHGGQLAVLETEGFTVRSLRQCDASGIRGISLSRDGKSLLLSHNLVNPSNPTTQPMVFYGFVVSSGVLILELENLLAPSKSKRIHQFGFLPLGDVKVGAGDPGQMQFLQNGGFAVCLSGVNEVAIGTGPGDVLTRIPVGRRPVSLAESMDGRFLYVANYFDDTITVIDIEKKVILRNVLLNNNQPETPSTGRRGEILFYDARVSLHGWSSCHSCHVDGHTTAGLADTLSDGTMYTPKRIPSLLGTVGTGPWGWNGMKINLHDQVLQSMRVTMQGGEMKKDTPENAALIVDYLATLKLPVRASINSAYYRSGIKIFNRLGCNECHALPGLTSRKSFDVGLRDEKGWKLFNPPSLLGLRHGNRFLHDNRADSLNAVFTEHGHPDGEPPTGKDLQSILSFLRNL